MTAPTVAFANAVASLLDRRPSRRQLLTRFAIASSAVATSGFDYLLRPGTAYASICGTGSSCAGAWTVLCCTINNGVNQCPPGSFAGGWWKAEGASLCGGSARYFVDCQAECTRCECHGSAFCEEHCWDCKPHCAHKGTCDERRVCSNVFRYGQCEHERGCSGPVMCRVTSCTPPWKWANCSTTAATDDFTASHSAPCLPRWSPIQHRYTALGSQGSPLGASIGGEIHTGHYHLQRYVHGRMYWTNNLGAHYLTGPVAHHYVKLGEGRSPLGLPTTDVRHPHDGPAAYAEFQHGAIFRGRGLAPHALWQAVWRKYRDLDAERGPLGYPTTDQTTAADGKGQYAHFQTGVIYQGPGLKPHELFAAFAAKYRAVYYERGPLGYPTTDPRRVRDQTGKTGTEVLFTSGAIDQLDGNEPFAVWGPIYAAWNDRGRTAGQLGFPVTDVYKLDATHLRCNFEYGYATLDETTGQVTVTTSQP